MKDEDILYTMGKYRLTWISSDARKNIIKRYKIDPKNPRPGIIDYTAHDTIPIIPDEEEYIHRDRWDLPALVGETEKQILHPHYYELYKHMDMDGNIGHDVLTVFQCSSKKPYYENKTYKYNYIRHFNKYSDFAWMSNPGLIPSEFSSYYPYRYDEWNLLVEDKIEPTIHIRFKNMIVKICRFLRYVKRFGYKDTIVVMGNDKEQWVFNEMYKYNICNCREWLHIITNDSFRAQVNSDNKYKNLSGLGFLSSRLAGLKATRESYKNTLMNIVNNNQNSPLISSFVDAVDINAIYKRYRLEPNKNLMYRNCYWTVLDMILETPGNKVLDIDKVYWDKYEELKKDSNYVQLDDTFVFIDKKYADKIDDIRKEAYKLRLIKDDKEFILNPNVFNFLTKPKNNKPSK